MAERDLKNTIIDGKKENIEEMINKYKHLVHCSLTETTIKSRCVAQLNKNLEEQHKRSISLAQFKALLKRKRQHQAHLPKTDINPELKREFDKYRHVIDLLKDWRTINVSI